MLIPRALAARVGVLVGVVAAAAVAVLAAAGRALLTWA